MGKFNFLRVYLSPFKMPIPRLYVGRLRFGTPIFYPRIWKKHTPESARKAALEKDDWFMKDKTFEERYKYFLKCQYPVPRKIGFDFVGMGWKTKWTDIDYRFEWGAIWSFVFFGLQLAVTFRVPHQDHYWECWLYYSRETDKSRPTRERVEQARKGFPCVWTNHSNGKEEIVCYWDKVLKRKYTN